MNVRRARPHQRLDSVPPQNIRSSQTAYGLPILFAVALSACGGGQSSGQDNTVSAQAQAAPTVTAQTAAVAAARAAIPVSSVRTVGAPARPSSGNRIETHPGVPPRQWIHGQDKAGDLLEEQPKH